MQTRIVDGVNLVQCDECETWCKEADGAESTVPFKKSMVRADWWLCWRCIKVRHKKIQVTRDRVRAYPGRRSR